MINSQELLLIPIYCSQEEPGGQSSEKLSRRDPRLQKLKEKQEKSLTLPPPPPVMTVPQTVKKSISPTPIINLDLSKDKICKETLQQVDEEMKAIAVTVFPKVSVSSSITDQSQDLSSKSAFYKKNLEASYKKEYTVDTPREVKRQVTNNPKHETAPPAKTKTVHQQNVAGACFDFLAESKPKEKSFKYLSKREELSRKPVKKVREKCDKVPDTTKDLIKIEQSISQEKGGERRQTVETLEEWRRKHSKKRSVEKDERSASKNSDVQKKKKRKKEKKHHDEPSQGKHSRRDEKKKRDSPSLDFCDKSDPIVAESPTLTCKLCGEEFSVSKSYRRHFKTAHIYKCGKCPLKFNSEEKQKTHTSRSHGKDSEVKDEEIAKEEIDSEDDNEKVPQINICSLCGDSFKTSLELTEHISSPHIAPCFDCDLMFVDFSSLLNHKKTHGPQEVATPVVTVSKTSDSSNRLEDEENLHQKKRKKVKVEALSEMAIIQDVADLIKIDSALIEKSKEAPVEEVKSDNKRRKSSDEHHCKSCGKVFVTEKDLFHHTTLNHFENWSYADPEKNTKRSENCWDVGGDSDGPFVCNLCSEVFKLWGSLLKHLWAPHFFKCEYCGKSFNRNTKLEDHVNKEHDFVGFIDTTKCGLCEETFGRSSSLARHIKSPHNFPCDRCPLRFPIKSALTRHKKNCTRNEMKDILDDCINQIPS